MLYPAIKAPGSLVGHLWLILSAKMVAELAGIDVT